MGIAIDRSAARCEALLCQSATERVKMCRAFSHLGSTIDDAPTLSRHYCKNSFASVEKGSVQNQVTIRRQIDVVHGRMPEPVSNHPLQSTDTVTTLTGQLSQGVAFYDPTLEPNLLAQTLVGVVAPNKCAATPSAPPTLLSLSTLAISLHLGRATNPTMLFLPSNTTIVERLQQ